MRHIPGGNPFQLEDPYPGAGVTARRALSQLNFECSGVKRILRICEALKLKPKCPFWLEDCVSHIGLPTKKTVIYHRSFSERARMEAARERWGVHGWKVLSITTTAMDRVTDSQLSAHLEAALKGLSK